MGMGEVRSKFEVSEGLVTMELSNALRADVLQRLTADYGLKRRLSTDYMLSLIHI